MRRLGAGVYETTDGRFRILRTQHDGPRGGTPQRWEIATPDRSGWVIDDWTASRTLAEARTRLIERRQKERV